MITHTTELYFEAHITIEPVFDARRLDAAFVAEVYRFRLAELLMRKRETDTARRSDKDTFMTGHSADWHDIVQRTTGCVRALREAGFKVWRYKIENTLLDSRRQDALELLI